MTKKRYIKPTHICEMINISNLLTEASIELKTTNGQASDSYDILSKEAVWSEEEE